MAGEIAVRCDACGKRFRVPGDQAGRKVRCQCGEPMSVPRLPSGEALARKWYYAKEGERHSAPRYD